MRASLALFALGLAVGLYFGTVSMSLIAFGFYVLVTGVFFLVRAVSKRPLALKAMLPPHGYFSGLMIGSLLIASPFGALIMTIGAITGWRFYAKQASAS